MAQTGYTPIQLYRTATGAAVPLAANLAVGELAINYNDGKLFYEDNLGVVQVLATKDAAAGVFDQIIVGSESTPSVADIGTDDGRCLSLIKTDAFLATEEIWANFYSANTNDAAVYNLGGIKMTREDGGFGVRSSLSTYVKLDGSGGGQFEASKTTYDGNYVPGVDNAFSLGESLNRWSVVYSATGTINTSDVRTKKNFGESLGLQFILSLQPVSYQFKVGGTKLDHSENGGVTKTEVEGVRRHHGLKAQQVKEVLDSTGVDFAGWVLENPSNPESAQGLRYDQFIAPLIKAIQEQQHQINELKAEVQLLRASNES